MPKHGVRPLRSEIRDNMRIDWDIPIVMSDGVVLRADVYRPPDDAAYPALMSYGPYGKNLLLQDGYPWQWKITLSEYADVASGSTNKYQSWEVVDPEKWVPEGYAVIRVDSRGAGRSPGVIDCFSPRETQDFYDCIEWVAVQFWCTGKVGLNGISYYAANQWLVAARQPPSLAAICVWEGFSDFYREAARHGGILCTFLGRWFPVQVASVQYGVGARGRRNPLTSMSVSGDVELDEGSLKGNRADIGQELIVHPFDDGYYEARTPDLSKVQTPLLSCGNWGGHGLHLRGNINGFMLAGSHQKWLEVHGGEHWTIFYTDYGRSLQLRFFNYFLKGEGDWDRQPRVQLQVRHPGEKFVQRAEMEWPLARTRWTKLFINPSALTLSMEPAVNASHRSHSALGEGINVLAAPADQDIEITGPLACKLWISSTSADADIFLVVRLFDASGEEVLFIGATERSAPIAQGWLRASHRRLDLQRSTPWQPYHPHLETEPLIPEQPYELDVEIWPTSIVVPRGYRLGLTILGRDYDHGKTGVPSPFGFEMRGCGFHPHDEPRDRPAELFDSTITVYGGGDRLSHLLVPIIPR